jgi:hypothetical protein
MAAWPPDSPFRTLYQNILDIVLLLFHYAIVELKGAAMYPVTTLYTKIGANWLRMNTCRRLSKQRTLTPFRMTIFCEREGAPSHRKRQFLVLWVGDLPLTLRAWLPTRFSLRKCLWHFFCLPRPRYTNPIHQEDPLPTYQKRCTKKLAHHRPSGTPSPCRQKSYSEHRRFRLDSLFAPA